jgi:hypothetical protein
MLRRLAFSSCLLALTAAVGAFSAAADSSGGGAAAPLTGETLTTNNYLFQGGVFNCNPSGTTTFTITFSGAAAGPYPGTFDETATVTIGSGALTQFDASFTIMSATGTVTGTKHLAAPGVGQCTTNPTVPNPFCPPISSESFSGTTAYDATIDSATGTSTDRGASPVSFTGLQEQCVQAVLHDGAFTESFTSAGPSQPCDSGNGRKEGHEKADGGQRDEHANEHACRHDG